MKWPCPHCGKETAPDLTPDTAAPVWRFHIDGAPYTRQGRSISGVQVLVIAERDPNYEIMLEGRGDEPDRQIDLREAVPMSEFMHFYTVPRGIFGG